MAQTVKFRAEIEVTGIPSGCGDFETMYPVFDITVSYIKGSPAVMYQRNGDPGWPADPPEIELLDVALHNGDGISPTKEQMWDWVEEWLDSDEGFVSVVEEAERRDDG